MIADKSSLENAKSMNAKGASSEDIRLATGWHRGYDGKWRFEIDDSQMEIKDIESNYMKLDQLLKHDKLFDLNDKSKMVYHSTNQEVHLGMCNSKRNCEPFNWD